MMIVGLLLAVLVGVSVSILGGGRAILTVPIFVYVMGFDTKEAVASSLAVVGMTSLSGAVSHWREGRLRIGIAFVFGIFAMAGAYLGARLAVFFSSAGPMGGDLLASALGFWAAFFVPGAALLVLAIIFGIVWAPRLRSGKRPKSWRNVISHRTG